MSRAYAPLSSVVVFMDVTYPDLLGLFALARQHVTPTVVVVRAPGYSSCDDTHAARLVYQATRNVLDRIWPADHIQILVSPDSRHFNDIKHKNLIFTDPLNPEVDIDFEPIGPQLANVLKYATPQGQNEIYAFRLPRELLSLLADPEFIGDCRALKSFHVYWATTPSEFDAADALFISARPSLSPERGLGVCMSEEFGVVYIADIQNMFGCESQTRAVANNLMEQLERQDAQEYNYSGLRFIMEHRGNWHKLMDSSETERQARSPWAMSKYLQHIAPCITAVLGPHGEFNSQGVLGLTNRTRRAKFEIIADFETGGVVLRNHDIDSEPYTQDIVSLFCY